MSSFPTRIGILGWTGLVGQTLFHQLIATGTDPVHILTYNSKNLQEIRGVTFQTLYIACMPATKWWANKYPDEDKATLSNVLEALNKVQANRVILISTVDVLQSDQEANEESQAWATHTYGHNRRLLEIWVQSKWPATSHILRLPALFGRGLKKNALYDLIHNNNCTAICLDSQFQWYNLAHLTKDIQTTIRLNIRIIHLVSPPIPMREIIQCWFQPKSQFCNGTQPVKYNLTTCHGGTPDGPYNCTKEKLLQQMGEWITWEQWRLSHTIAASNIGFTMSPDVAATLHHIGITALEVAPTRGTNYADFKPVSMQSLLYGTPITNIFYQSAAFLEHLQKLMASAQAKGIRTFVFGSPRQRDVTQSFANESHAIELFRQLGNLASLHDITVCVEPNAKAYGCTWLTTVADTLEFVQKVNHSNIRLSLDSGNYFMENDQTLISEIPLEWIGHLQISAAHLSAVMTDKELTTAKNIVNYLCSHKSREYTGTISYEAREVGFKEYCKGLGQFMDLLESQV